MSNDGHVIENATVTINGVDISGTLNQTEISTLRDEISWRAYADDAHAKSSGARDEHVFFKGLYSAGTSAAFDTLFDLYASGAMGTLIVGDNDPDAGGTFTAMAQVTEYTGSLNKGIVGLIDCVFIVHGVSVYLPCYAILATYDAILTEAGAFLTKETGELILQG